MSVITAASPAFAGTFSTGSFTDDATSGVSPKLPYTALVDFAQTTGAPFSVNGVAFSDLGNMGQFYRLYEAGSGVAASQNNLAVGGMRDVMSAFVYSPTTGHSKLELSGLVPGQQYVTTWYSLGYGGGLRSNIITASDTNTQFTYDQNASGGTGSKLIYTFIATGATITYDINRAVDAGFHFFAFSNQGVKAAVSPLVTPTIERATQAGTGAFTPIFASGKTAVGDDLLQTSVSNTIATGLFTSEGGKLINLNNGLFSIPSAATLVANNTLATPNADASVEYVLNTTASPFGYDIDRIETFGGWVNNGRDAQRIAIYYSLVGDSSFQLLGYANEETTVAATTSSAIHASFDTNLTNVDSIRFDFPADQENGYAGYGELDVIGVASVPEPASLGLLLVGGIGWCARRKRARG